MIEETVPLSSVFHNTHDEPEVLVSAELERYAMERDEFKFFTYFHPAYARTDAYGNCGVNMWMVLKGKLGAIQFMLLTNWHMQSAIDRIEEHGDPKVTQLLLHHPLPGDIGYHSPKPMYEGHRKRECQWLEQGYCYYDGSSLGADRVYKILVKFGSDGVWDYMRGYYNHLFLHDAIVETLVEDSEPHHEDLRVTAQEIANLGVKDEKE